MKTYPIAVHMCHSSFGDTHECWCEIRHNHSESAHKNAMRATSAAPSKENK